MVTSSGWGPNLKYHDDYCEYHYLYYYDSDFLILRTVICYCFIAGAIFSANIIIARVVSLLLVLLLVLLL